jgi:hypothetical protein
MALARRLALDILFIQQEMVARDGIEPSTRGFSARRRKP